MRLGGVNNSMIARSILEVAASQHSWKKLLTMISFIRQLLEFIENSSIKQFRKYNKTWILPKSVWTALFCTVRLSRICEVINKQQ